MFSFLFADTKAVNYQEGDTDVESEQEEKEKPPNKKKKQDVKSNTQNNKKNNKNKQTDNRSKNKRTISSGSDSESEFQTVSKKRKIAKEKKSDDKNPEWNEVENQNISTSLGNKRPRYAKDGLKLEEKEQLRKSKKQNLDKTKTSDDTGPKKKVECTSDIIIRKSDSIDRIVRSARRRKRDENDDVSVISYEYCY